MIEELEDPDLLSGVVDAPPRPESRERRLHLRRSEHLGLMFGALAASPSGVVKGRGVPLSQLSFGLLVFRGVWDLYLQWREQRRGCYTKWEEDMLMVAQALTRAEALDIQGKSPG